MTAADFLETIGIDNPRAATTWIKNPSDSLREIFIEPWASTIYLLARREYAIITESEDDGPPPGATLELGDPITVWPEGASSNRLFRDDGNLVWDDAEPRGVHPIIPAGLIQPLLDWARANPFSHPDRLREFLKSELTSEEIRSDLPLLLVEHGLLSMDAHGNVFDPRRSEQTAGPL